MHALIIREPWFGHIIAGAKTWEMRTKPTRQRGLIGLIRKGTGLVAGVAEIIDCLLPLDSAGLAATRNFHRIPPELDAEVLRAGWICPWVLHHARRLSQPVPAGQKAGQVTWVPLDHEAIAAIEAQMGGFARAVMPKAEAAVPDSASVAAPVRTTVVSQRIGSRPLDDPDGVTIDLTAGAIRNGNLSVRTALHLLPDDVVGGASRQETAERRLTVVFDPDETVETDIAGDKMLLRCRGAVSDFYARSGAKGGDLVHLRRDRSGNLHVRHAPGQMDMDAVR